MIAVHYMKHKDDNEKGLFYTVRKSLFAHGIPAVEGEEDRPGPFTIKEYFQYIIKENSWGDVTCLFLIASMWSCRISVVNSTTLGEMHVHHNMEQGLTDTALVLMRSSLVLSGCKLVRSFCTCWHSVVGFCWVCLFQ